MKRLVDKTIDVLSLFRTSRLITLLIYSLKCISWIVVRTVFVLKLFMSIIIIEVVVVIDPKTVKRDQPLL